MEHTNKPKNYFSKSTSNPLEWTGEYHNSKVEEYFNLSCESTSIYDIADCLGLNTDNDEINLLLTMVDSINIVTTDDGLKHCIFPQVINNYFSSHPVLMNFQNDLVGIVNDATMNNYDSLSQEIINLENSYAQLLNPKEDSLVYIVGSVARHSHYYWTTSGNGNIPSSDRAREVILADFTTMWTVGVISIFAPGVGLGVALVSGAVSSVQAGIS